jgi:hypothetical protein
MKAVSSSETSVNFNEITWRILEGSHLYTSRREFSLGLNWREYEDDNVGNLLTSYAV